MNPAAEIARREERMRAAIVDRYAQAESMDQIGDSYGIGWKKVREVLRDAGVKIRSYKETAALRDRLQTEAILRGQA
jgi:hypothetical protein